MKEGFAGRLMSLERKGVEEPVRDSMTLRGTREPHVETVADTDSR